MEETDKQKIERLEKEIAKLNHEILAERQCRIRSEGARSQLETNLSELQDKILEKL